MRASMAASLAAHSMLHHLDLARRAPLMQFLQHLDRTCVNHPFAPQASNAEVVAPASKVADRIEFVASHAFCWNR